MLDTIAAILSAVAALISSMIGGKVYYDSTRGPNIRLVERHLSFPKDSKGINIGTSFRLIFVNTGGQRGALVTAGAVHPTTKQGDVSVVLLNTASKLPAVIEPSAAISFDADVQIKSPPSGIRDVFGESDKIQVTMQYEVTTRSLKTETRESIFELRLI